MYDKTDWLQKEFILHKSFPQVGFQKSKFPTQTETDCNQRDS